MKLIVALAAAGLVPFAFADKQGVLDATANTYTITVAANATVTLVHPECLDATKRYVVAEAGGTLAGDVPSLVCASGGRWTLAKHGKKLILELPRGTAILFR